MPSNYRGIIILNALYKLYDGILDKLFILWFKPDVEQGTRAQESLGCVEQLLNLQLLIMLEKLRKFCI